MFQSDAIHTVVQMTKDILIQVQPAARSSSQAPQASKELQLSASANSIETASPDFRENSQDLSPDLVLAEPDIPFDNAKEELPDLGKFPFFRRRRGKVVTGRSIVRQLRRLSTQQVHHDQRHQELNLHKSHRVQRNLEMVLCFSRHTRCETALST